MTGYGDWLLWRGCESKSGAWESCGAAHRAAAAHRRRGGSLWPYECPFCGLWHLTSINPYSQKKETT